MVNATDTAWLLVSSALVMLMTPGLALLHGGMVRRKNVLSTIMMSFAILALVGVLWVVYGYSLSFGPDKGGVIGGLDWVGFRQVGQEPSSTYATTVPHLAYMIFQAMFAIITVALFTGAIVERMKFSALMVFSVLWLTFVYSEVVILDEDVPIILNAITSVTRTGEIGDGKLFVLPVENAVRVRTGDEGDDAI